ncbi:MAG: exodeoxyribonuclease VII small subunit [Terriglobales bacterium]
MPASSGFELSLERLEAIVKELENAELPLERSVELFEEGMKLVEDCRKQLDVAEGKVEMLVKRAGAATVEPFLLDEDARSDSR